jgi:O-antigen/teichoic acid export membrane protein
MGEAWVQKQLLELTLSSPGQFIRNVRIFGIAQLVSWTATGATTILMPTLLGDTNLGKLVFARSFTLLFSQLGRLGIQTYLAKEVPRDRPRAGWLIANALGVSLPLSLAAMALAALAVSVGPHDDLTRQVVYVSCAAAFLGTVNYIIHGALQGLESMKALASLPALTQVASAGVTLGLLLLGAGPLELATGWVIVNALLLGLSLRLLARVERPHVRFQLGAWRTIAVGSLPFFVSSGSQEVYHNMDRVLLGFMVGDAVVGWYAAASRLVHFPLFIPTIIMTIAFPALAAASRGNSALFARIARRTVQVVVLCCLPLALGFMLLADRVIGLLGYPTSFANSIVPMILLGPHLGLVAVDMMLGAVLITRDLQRQWMLVSVTAVVLNTSLNLLAIPYTQGMFGNGAIGAAAVMTLMETFMFVSAVRLMPPDVFDRATVVHALKCLLAGLAMVATVGATRDLPLAVPVLAGALTYSGFCLALGAVSLADIVEVRTHLLRRAAPEAPA